MRCPAQAPTRGHRDRHRDMGTGIGTRHRDRPWKPVPPRRGHEGQSSQCSCSHPTLSEGLQRGGHPERHRPWGPDPAAPPARIQPERGPGSAARARLRLHRIPPSPPPLPPLLRRGTQASGPAPTHRRLRGVRRGRGSVGWDPRGGPAAVSVSAAPGMRSRGEKRSRGVPLPAAAARQEGSGGASAAPPSLLRRVRDTGRLQPALPSTRTRPRGEHAAAPRRSRPREGKGCRGEPPREDPAPRGAGPAPLRGAHAAARHCRGKGGTRRAPTLRQDPRAGEPPQTGSTGVCPCSTAAPAPLALQRSRGGPGCCRGSGGVRCSPASRCGSRCRCRWQSRAGGSRLKVAVPG